VERRLVAVGGVRGVRADAGPAGRWAAVVSGGGTVVYVAAITVPGDTPPVLAGKLLDSLAGVLPAHGLDPGLERRSVANGDGTVTLVLEATGPPGLQMGPAAAEPVAEAPGGGWGYADNPGASGGAPGGADGVEPCTCGCGASWAEHDARCPAWPHTAAWHPETGTQQADAPVQVPAAGLLVPPAGAGIPQASGGAPGGAQGVVESAPPPWDASAPPIKVWEGKHVGKPGGQLYVWTAGAWQEESVPCRTFWGSHGCSLPRGHTGWLVRHQCGLDEAHWRCEECGAERADAETGEDGDLESWLEKCPACGSAAEPYDANPDGPCCVVKRQADPLTGEQVWERFQPFDGPFGPALEEKLGWPVVVFGADVPPGHGGDQEVADLITLVRRTAGQLPG
jgi:hypothetical protein